jgi:CheY-like chemotaxis protein
LSIEDHPQARFNLSKASVLLLDSTSMGLSILFQITKGFGAYTIYKCTDVNHAKEIARSETLHLLIVDALSPSDGGYEFVRWMRREAPEPNSFSPIILIEGHTRPRDVAKARDCGANFMLKRPLSPLQLMERIIWIGGEDRSFVVGASYAGPDRRFHNGGAPAGGGRRWNDAKPMVADSAESDGQDQSPGTETTA